jgi:hypothetical protein
MSQLALLEMEPASTLNLPVVQPLWDDPPTDVQWSVAAHSAARRCQLQYFHGFKMANAQSRDAVRREAWVLNQLQDLPRWRGRLVDYGMENVLVPALKSGKIPSLDDMVNTTLAVARRQWGFSLSRQYRQDGLRKGQYPDDFCALYEHEYGMPVEESDRLRVEAEVVESFSNLLGLTDFLDHLRRQRSFMPQRTLWVTFERARVKAVPDLICWRGQETTIVDWKATTSETSDHSWQMLVYALAVQRNWPQTRAEDIVVHEVRLLDGMVVPHPVSEARLEATEDLLYQSVLEIEALTGGKPYDELHRDEFEPARSSRTCATCNFRKICLEGRE